MSKTKVFVSYDKEGDMLEVLWALREGYFSPSGDERILTRLDDDGEVIGFLIHDFTSLTEPDHFEFVLEPEQADADVTNVDIRHAARQLGVTDGRVRQLAREGRVKGAIKAGYAWRIPTPVEIIPGRRGPAGLAMRPDSQSG